MRFNELIWDGWNEDHIARHGITPNEVEEVALGPNSLTRRADRAQQRYAIVGRTHAGRLLVVIVDREGERSAYVITARPLSRREQRRFKAGGR